MTLDAESINSDWRSEKRLKFQTKSYILAFWFIAIKQRFTQTVLSAFQDRFFAAQLTSKSWLSFFSGGGIRKRWV